MKTKIIEFIDSLNDGGAETLVKDYALMIDKLKFEIEIIVLRNLTKTANVSVLRENNIKIIPIYKKWNFLYKAIYLFTNRFYTPFKLKCIIKRENPDVIHTHLALLKYLSPISKTLKNIRLLYTCHNLPKLLFDGKRKNEFEAAKKLFDSCDFRLIALHSNMKKELDDMFDVKTTKVVKNGIDFNRFRNVIETQDEIRTSLGIPQNAFVVGHIGRFSEQKNHAFLVEIFKELSNRKDNAYLMLVGDGDLKESVELKLNEYGLGSKVRFLSHRKDVPRLLKAMDVFVFPSKFEGLGIVLIEAQVSNLKCIVSDKVPREAFLTSYVTSMGLDVSVDKWCDAILDASLEKCDDERLDEYDMNKEIKYLEKLYLGEYNE